MKCITYSGICKAFKDEIDYLTSKSGVLPSAEIETQVSKLKKILMRMEMTLHKNGSLGEALEDYEGEK
jgi:hypothetical protein